MRLKLRRGEVRSYSMQEKKKLLGSWSAEASGCAFRLKTGPSSYRSWKPGGRPLAFVITGLPFTLSSWPSPSAQPPGTENFGEHAYIECSTGFRAATASAIFLF